MAASNTISHERMLELLAKARAAHATPAETQAHDALEIQVATQRPQVDFTGTGVATDKLEDEAQEEAAVDFIKDVISNVAEQICGVPLYDEHKVGEPVHKEYGVSRDVELNIEQQAAQDLICSGEDCILLGAAGTGKTTTMKKTTRRMIDSGMLGTIIEGSKWLIPGKPGCAVISYTRKAVNNIRHAVVEELKAHTITAHKLIEFAPVVYEIEDPANPGQLKATMKFEPKRNALNPLPRELVCLIHEESSMEACELYSQVEDAMPHPHQEVFIGDIQQLPPVFGSSILGFKMLELPIVELVHVYRQARDNPILDLAWKLLEGDKQVFWPATVTTEIVSPHTGKKVKRVAVPALDALSRDKFVDDDPTKELIGHLKFQVWQAKLEKEHALLVCAKQMTTWADEGIYNPDEDIILIPFNESFGTIELNRRIAQHLGKKREAIVHEVIAGFEKHYLAVGDRVLYDKEDAFIVSISRNVEYHGKSPCPASVYLDRWGGLEQQLTEEEKLLAEAEDYAMSEAALDQMMAAAANAVDERVTTASHDIVIRFAYGDGEEKCLSKASDVNNLLGGYSMTFYKSQGSEFERGFIVLHSSHAVQLVREQLYTGVTRFRKWLHIICETNSFYNGVQRQKIVGNTLKEKAEFFKGEMKKVTGNFHISMTYKHGGTLQLKKKGVRPEDLVSAEMAAEAQHNLELYWKCAINIFDGYLGEMPKLLFNMRRQNCLGLAFYQPGIIKLNPIWVAVGETDKVVKHEMLIVTLIHEIAHIIAWRLYRDRGHGEGWKSVMRALNQTPDITYNDNQLPPWAQAKKELMLDFLRNREVENFIDEPVTDDEPINERLPNGSDDQERSWEDDGGFAGVVRQLPVRKVDVPAAAVNPLQAKLAALLAAKKS